MDRAALPFSDACERNKGPILAILEREFRGRTSVLEVGSGTGQHAVHFGAHLPQLVWQATERARHLPGLAARIAAEGGPNVPPPLELEVGRTDWRQLFTRLPIDAVYTANTLHIMSWPESLTLIRRAAELLPAGGMLCIYGPFIDPGRRTTTSNLEFDRMLRERDAASGLRSLDEVIAKADGHGLDATAAHDMPSHNRLLVLQKRG